MNILPPFRKILALMLGLFVGSVVIAMAAPANAAQGDDLKHMVQGLFDTESRSTAITVQPARQDNAHFIACPVERLRTEVVTNLPRDWWQTPQIGKLEATRVQRIGGKDTLVCAYRAYGATASVMRLPPQGSGRCRAAENGFYCE